MSKVYRALAVATLALGLLFPTHQALADDAADVEAVERELEAEANALALYKRARERAQLAVQASSLAQEYETLSDLREEAWDVYKRASDDAKQARDKADIAFEKARRAESEARRKIIPVPKDGEDEIGARIRAMDEWRANDQTRPHAMALLEQSASLGEVAESLFQEYLVASDKARAYSERVSAMIDTMAAKFLADEIARAVEKELGDLERELRELEKKARKGVTI